MKVLILSLRSRFRSSLQGITGNRAHFLMFGMLPLILGVLVGCETPHPQAKIPVRLLFLQAEALADQGLRTDAITKYGELVAQNPGSLMAAFSYLKVGELLEKAEKWEEAETNYRLFLASTQNSDLTPYVLYRLVSLQHKKSYTGLLFRTREIDRDMAPNRGIIQEYKRFYFLYPKSIFLDEVRGFYRDARESLAEYENLVADYYFDRGQYNAAASRYLYLLKYFSGYKKSGAVVERLILSYRRNQQPELADELERLQNMKGAKRPGAAPESAGPYPSLPGSDAISRLK